MALHISLNAQQKLTSKLHAFVTLQRPFKLFFKKRSDLPCTVTMVIKHIALLGILEKLAGDHWTALECELLKLSRKRNGMAQHVTE